MSQYSICASDNMCQAFIHGADLSRYTPYLFFKLYFFTEPTETRNLFFSATLGCPIRRTCSMPTKAPAKLKFFSQRHSALGSGTYDTNSHPSSTTRAYVSSGRTAWRHATTPRADYQVNAFQVPHTAIAYLSALSPSEGYGKSYTTFPRDNQR